MAGFQDRYHLRNVPLEWDLKRRTGSDEARYNSNSSVVYESVSAVCNVLKRFGKVNTHFPKYYIRREIA